MYMSYQIREREGSNIMSVKDLILLIRLLFIIFCIRFSRGGWDGNRSFLFVVVVGGGGGGTREECGLANSVVI